MSEESRERSPRLWGGKWLVAVIVLAFAVDYIAYGIVWSGRYMWPSPIGMVVWSPGLTIAYLYAAALMADFIYKPYLGK